MKILLGNINNIDKTLVDRWKSAVDKSRVAKVCAKRFENDRLLSILGDLLAITLAAKTLNKPENEIKLCHEESGKPYIGGEKIHISISHSNEVAVCAIDTDPLGVDIEYIRDFKTSTLQKICSEKEILYIDGDNRKFFKVWTVKEAYSKLLGVGIGKIVSGIYTDIENGTVEGKPFYSDYFEGYVYSIVTNRERMGGIEKD